MADARPAAVWSRRWTGFGGVVVSQDRSPTVEVSSVSPCKAQMLGNKDHFRGYCMKSDAQA